MTSKHALEAVNKLFRDFSKNNIVFGNTVMIVSVDFGQTLPVAKHGNRTTIIENCVNNINI